MIQEEIKKVIESAAKNMGVEVPVVLVEAPKEKTHGDYSTNVALSLSKKLGKSPLEIAQKIAGGIQKPDFLEKVEAVAPGFINFYLSKEYFVGQLKNIDTDFGKAKKPFFGAKKVIVEYTDPNILKEFHIGHLMSNAIGESIARIFEFQGANLKRVNYQGDVGLHVAKALWGKLKNPDMVWAQAYAFGAGEYEENETAKKEIVGINKKVFEKSDKEINALYSQGRKDSLAYFDTIYKKLGTDFDRLFFESEVADTGKKIVMEHVGRVFEKGDKGAIVFKGESEGLHTRVFVNSEGLPTYEAKDLALPELKYGYFKYDNSIIITAHEQNAYFDVMLAALGKIKPELAKKTRHIGHGMLRLPEGKMSSRTGKVVTAESLIERIEAQVAQKAADKNIDSATIQKIAIGALKYSILKQSIGSDIIFDFDKSISFEGDSGPYLQYSYVRAVSVIQKAKGERVKASLKNIPQEITQLEKMMRRFPEVVEKSAAEYEPHIITLYLTELAREFNNYYANHKIVDKADEFSPYKVALTEAFSIIMKNGLWLLGIQAPEKM
ncbi:MAG: arginine--tRNA ligase [bacterium]|nr:arginine--tRNA ligase [bacterium]